MLAGIFSDVLGCSLGKDTERKHEEDEPAASPIQLAAITLNP